MEAKGLEPSNLLTASQALYQLSYAPEGCQHSIRDGPDATHERPGVPSEASCQTTNLGTVEPYDFREVEERWQRRWDEDGTYQVDQDDPRPAYYVLSMYP